MSNELMTTFANTLPAEIRAALAENIAEDLKRLGNIGGNDAITITQDKQFAFPDGTKSSGPLDLVVVDFVYRNEYYTTPYNPKDPKAPTCFAVNPDQQAMTPTDNSPSKQSDTCLTCKWNKFGSSTTGDGKACKNTVYLAVLPPDSTSDSPLYVMKTSPTAIRPFNQHVAKIGRTVNLPIWGVTTKVGFDPNVSYASLRFDIAGPNPIAEESYARKDEARHRISQEPDFSTAVA